MFNSLKMARLDYFVFKSQIISYAALILMTVMFSLMGSSFVTLGITVAWFVALLSTNIFSIQEKNELEELYASLPFNLKSIIRGRYIFTFVNYALAMILTIIIGVSVSFMQKKNLDYADTFLGICISLLAFTIISGIQIPIYFKLGYTKAKAWCMIPFILVMAICILPFFLDAFLGIITGLMEHQMKLEIIILIISFIVLLVSYNLSVKCYQKSSRR